MKRTQKPKREANMGNRDYYDAMTGIRSSNAAQPHRNKAKYRRPKSGAAKWGQDD
jgi:hypothetical protein